MSTTEWRPIWCWTPRFHCCAYPSRKFGSKLDRDVPPVSGVAGTWPLESEMVGTNGDGFVSVWARRSGGFWPFEPPVPVSGLFQNMPNPPRTTVRPWPFTSYANPRRGAKFVLEYVWR
jgi:hypothetical protein